MEKILIYNTSFFSVSETFVYNQVRALAEKHEIHLLASKYLNPQGYDDSIYTKYEVHRSTGFVNRVAEKFLNARLFTIQSYRTLRKLFAENKYKAIHAHYGTKAVEILPLAKWFQVPLVVSFHGADASRILKIERYRRKLPALFNYTSAIIISSQHMADNLGLHKWNEKVKLIPYGIDSDYFKSDKTEKGGETIKILHIGRIVGKKGVPDLIKVFHQLSKEYDNIELHLAGDGEEMNQCRELVEKFNLNRKVIFYGNVTYEKVKELLEEADIYVLNSRVDEEGDMEGTPNTILEAMCMGKPVISTRHAGIPFVIENGRNGLLVNERNNRELKKSVEKLIENPDLREKLGVEANKTILESYTLDVMEKKIKDLFGTL